MSKFYLQNLHATFTIQIRKILIQCLWLLSQVSFSLSIHSIALTLPRTNKSLAFIKVLLACCKPMFQGILTHCSSIFFLSVVKGIIEFMQVAKKEVNLFSWLHTLPIILLVKKRYHISAELSFFLVNY